MNISFVIAAYNIETYIDECLNSVMSCIAPGDELIIVNDGSTDNTRKLIGAFHTIHPQLMIVDKKNGGLSSARNAGLAAASKDYVLFLDGDDVICANTVAEIRIHLDTWQPDILVTDYFEWLDDGKGALQPSRPRSHKAYQVTNTPVEHLLATLDDCIPCVWTRFFRRSLFQKLPPNPFPEWSMYDDMPTTPYLVAAAQTMLYVPKPLVKYRIRSGSLTKQRTARSCTDMVRAASHAAKSIDLLPESAELETIADVFLARKLVDAVKQGRELAYPTISVYKEMINTGLQSMSKSRHAALTYLQQSDRSTDRSVRVHLRSAWHWRAGYIFKQTLISWYKSHRRR